MNSGKYYFVLMVLISVCSCSTKPSETPLRESFDIQGHRGCRGLLPENSLSGFLRALELGVTTLEMDVVVSKDHQVLLSHEPYMSHLICTDSTGARITENQEKSYNIYQMGYEEIRQFDCGSLGNPNFLQQKSMASFKPLLTDVITAVEQRTAALGLTPVKYNIEIKSRASGDGLFHPAPQEFTDLLIRAIEQAGISERTIIQSFDPRPLQWARKQAPDLKLALLVENQDPVEKNLAKLGFDPEIYSPGHWLVDRGLVEFLRARKIQLIPWTVNDTTEMKKYVELGVDGIITDYPDRLLELLKQH